MKRSPQIMPTKVFYMMLTSSMTSSQGGLKVVPLYSFINEIETFFIAPCVFKIMWTKTMHCWFNHHSSSKKTQFIIKVMSQITGNSIILFNNLFSLTIKKISKLLITDNFYVLVQNCTKPSIWGGINRWALDSPNTWPVMRKAFSCHITIMPGWFIALRLYELSETSYSMMHIIHISVCRIVIPFTNMDEL